MKKEKNHLLFRGMRGRDNITFVDRFFFSPFEQKYILFLPFCKPYMQINYYVFHFNLQQLLQLLHLFEFFSSSKFCLFLTDFLLIFLIPKVKKRQSHSINGKNAKINFRMTNLNRQHEKKNVFFLEKHVNFMRIFYCFVKPTDSYTFQHLQIST